MSTSTLASQQLESGEFPSYDAEAFARQALSSPAALAAVIDHTLLKPEATREQALKLAREAAEFRFACAMVNPVWTGLVAAELAGTGIPVGVVVGFPLGANLTSTKREETSALLRLGAKEIDMVLSIGLLKSGETTRVARDIEAVVEVSHDAGAIVKVILETCLLTTEEKILASEIACAAGVDFLKTSTGFSTSGATAQDVALLRGVAGSRCGVKASGGIRTLADARTMLEAGANRIGASASVAIVQALTSQAI
ncbi:deoxyribose-phosphate aldolase [Silvibacterium dinghuense]|uniref:Deoxyribose-phosphate aldolase n=1 Tax=Silvibacterium dinghuense TaxID=1560006 RepID=A0A4Q1SE96_9BACT|nr:deoxyribose-phosphate aldolase [Silvibacterium dinghuense]RXS95453.1 deoxyribose-phosphate aldolase [Silvibacterium dinghuense]GGH13287.1 deoxyribose-phosphate aldolase [Silvibacterium dinghuense]